MPKAKTPEHVAKMRKRFTDTRINHMNDGLENIDSADWYNAFALVDVLEELLEDEQKVAFQSAGTCTKLFEENKELEKQNARLTSRGFEDLHNENENLKADYAKLLKRDTHNLKRLISANAQLDNLLEIPLKETEPNNSRYQRGWIAGWNAFYDEMQNALNTAAPIKNRNLLLIFKNCFGCGNPVEITKEGTGKDAISIHCTTCNYEALIY